MTTPPPRLLTGISPSAWQHPAEREAVRALGKVPGLDAIARRLIGALGARSLELTLQGDAVRVGPRQLPDLHGALQEVCEVLDVREDIALFVTRRPSFSAGAYGLSRPFIILRSEELSLLGRAQWHARLGVEVGHATSGCGTYRTLLAVLDRAAEGRLPSLAELAVLPLKLALQDWSRAADLSADRAGLLAVQDIRAMVRLHLTLAAGHLGGELAELNVDAYLRQAEEHQADSKDDSLLKVLGALDVSQALLIQRTAELSRWAKGAEYHGIVAGAYPSRSPPAFDADFAEAPPVEVPIGPGPAAAARAAASAAADEARRAARSAVQRFAGVLDRSAHPKKR